MGIKDIVDVLSSAVTALATILAGAWAYYRFVKGRVFTPRLTLTVDARQSRIDAAAYVVATLNVANVGLSRVEIESATLRVSSLALEPVAGGVTEPRRVWLDTTRVLLAHSWIESGEVLKEQAMVTLPLDHRAPVVVDFRVVAHDVSFSAAAIAEP